MAFVDTSDLAGTGAGQGAEMVGYKLGQTGSVARTASARLGDFVNVKDFGAAGDGVTDDTAEIQAAEDICAAAGTKLYFPAGTYRCNSGITKKSVDWAGDGKYATTLDFRGSGTFINATGTAGNRKQFTIRDMGFTGASASADAVGFTFGFNTRSRPLDNVRIAYFGRYGIQFDDQNWIVSFYDVLIDQCGHETTNGAGIFKAGDATGPGEFNDINFYSLNIENCGRTGDSTGGAILIVNDVANRSLRFVNCDIEGNRGTSEIFISNMEDLQFDNLYMETVSAQGESATFALNLVGCSGGFSGGRLAGADAGVNLAAVRLSAGANVFPSRIAFDRTSIHGFGTSILAGSCAVYTTMLGGERTFGDLDGQVQWFGDYAPRVSAHKNGTDQTVASGAFDKVTFGTERYDLTDAYSSSTLTPRTIGTYQVDAQVSWTSAADQDVLIVGVALNGTPIRYGKMTARGTGPQTVGIHAQVDTSSANDTIEIHARQTSGSNKTISGSDADTWFMANLIGRKS